MRPELLNNSLFLRYYNQWLKKPDSIVFASVAEYFLIYGMVDEAVKICVEGLKHSPNAVTGRLMLAKALTRQGNLDRAEDELNFVLDKVPSHTKALEMRTEIDLIRSGEIKPEHVAHVRAVEEEISNGINEVNEFLDERQAEKPNAELDELPAWQTVTMAKIYLAQGHEDKARAIYNAILSRDPSNQAARDALNSLGGGN